MNRTLKQLKKCSFDNLTYGELKEHELDCEEYCPLYGEFCNGGMKCYGDMPIEPPCVMFDNDTILSDKLFEFTQSQLRFEDMEDKILKLEHEKKQKNEQIALKRRQYKLRNSKELSEIKSLNSKNKNIEKTINYINNYILSVNSVNKMFRDTGSSCPQDIKESPKVEKLRLDMEQNKTKILELKNIIKQNEKTFKRLN